MNTQTYGFYKRTRKGKTIRLVQDKYIRSDVAFGYLAGKPISKEQMRLFVKSAPHNQLLVIDTKIALHQIDVLEHNCPATALVVVLQTVLQELRHLNLAVFRRMNVLMSDEKKSFIFFPNELSEETVVRRNPLESMNDANDRAIRSAAAFMNADLIENKAGNVVLITNDQDNKRKAIESGLTAMTMRNFVDQYLNEYPELLDLLAADTTSGYSSSSGAKLLYTPHVPIAQVLMGLKSKKYLRGTIRSKRDNWWECYVVVHTAEGAPRQSVVITGRWRVNRAVDGDVVAVELLSTSCDDNDLVLLQSEQGSSTEDTSRGGGIAGIAEDVADASPEAIEGLAAATSESSESTSSSSAAEASGASVTGPSQPAPVLLYGRVVGIIRRNWRQYAGSLDHSGSTDKVAASSDSGLSVLFQPVDNRIPCVRITTRRQEELVNKRLLVAIDHWPADSLYPEGHYVATLGEDGEKSVETAVLLHEFGVSHEDFSADVMACLPPVGWKITDDIIAPKAMRTDLRHLPIVSIDPPGCKDIDDALHCIRLPNGNYEAGVHIADVSYFVLPDSAMDKEAAHRSTSTYLVDRRLDMLPSLLTTELCSLRSKEDHLAFSVVWELTEQGDIVDVKFFKSVIHSVASLTYDEAQTMLDAPNPNDKVGQSVIYLNKFAHIFKNRRIASGALTLASPEVRFKLDSDNQNPTDVSIYALKEANGLVEEWMLLANITVAKKTLRHYPTLSILRRHQPPTREQFAGLLNAAAAAGVSLDISTSKTLADTLDLAVRPHDEYFNKLLRIMSTRCMMPAQYLCSGEIPKDQWHHYGIAAPVYTHFTSPIRRYADVLVHRLLAAAIGVIALPAANSDRTKQQAVCSHMNRRHKAAQYVQRASVNLHTLLFFNNRPSQEQAYVLSVSEDRFSVLVPRFGIEGAILLGPLADKLGGEVLYQPSLCQVSIVHGTDDQEDQTKQVLLSLQVFQKVVISIKVEKSAKAGTRQLIIALVLNNNHDDAAYPQPAHQLLSNDSIAIPLEAEESDDDEDANNKTSDVGDVADSTPVALRSKRDLSGDDKKSKKTKRAKLRQSK